MALPCHTPPEIGSKSLRLLGEGVTATLCTALHDFFCMRFGSRLQATTGPRLHPGTLDQDGSRALRASICHLKPLVSSSS